MSGPRLLVEAGRRSGVALLLAALLLPALFAGPGGTGTVCGPEEAVLVAPSAPAETPGEPERVSAPLLVLMPAALDGAAFEIPEPPGARLAPGEADRLSGSAVLAFVPPPPRRA